MSKLWPTILMPREGSRAEYELYCRLFDVAEQMKKQGIRVDVGRAKQHKVDADARAELFTRLVLHFTQLPASALGNAGAGQTAAMKEWFKAQGAPDVVFDKRTKKPQFNAPALTAWAEDYPGAPFAAAAAALLGLRKAKTSAKFAEAYAAVAERNDSRIHFGFNPLGTKGQRWSSSAKFSWMGAESEIVRYALNAQNVPSKKRTYDFGAEGVMPLMVSLKNCFVPDPGCVWGTADFDQLEARLIAYVTGAKLLSEWIATGRDLHMENARLLFPTVRIPATATKKDKEWAVYREAAKPMVYALTYAVTSHRGEPNTKELYKQLKALMPAITESMVKLIGERFYKVHPEIMEFHRQIRESLAAENKVILPQTGRALYLPDTMRGYNGAANYFFQSGGGALINRAIPEIAAGLPFGPGQNALLAMVHDSVEVQARESDLKEVAELVEKHMTASMDFGGIQASIPAAVDWGGAWGETTAKEEYYDKLGLNNRGEIVNPKTR